MGERYGIALLVIAGSILPAWTQTTMDRTATIRGNGGDKGKCTIEVEVDGEAEVWVAGGQGRIRTLSGQPSSWRRFECNGRLPRNPSDFRFRGIDGRGDVSLVRDPRDRGIAVVRIVDSKGGREGYTFDLEWSGGTSGDFGRFDDDDSFGRGGRLDDRRRDDRLGDNVSRSEAIGACRDAILDRLNNDGYSRVNIQSANVDNNLGRFDFITGRATARKRNDTMDFDFKCNMNRGTGRVRSVDINPR